MERVTTDPSGPHDVSGAPAAVSRVTAKEATLPVTTAPPATVPAHSGGPAVGVLEVALEHVAEILGAQTRTGLLAALLLVPAMTATRAFRAYQSSI